MKVFTKNAELSREMARGAGRTGLVPTMGALHEGHLSLVEKCRAECDRAVVSVFVNPTQFNDPNDLKNYPRTEEADLALLEKTGVDYVLMPSVEDIYPQKDTRVFDLGTTDKTMEGAHRPGHFNGVAQVVSRLFDIVRPERAYFGEKDFQQIAVIRWKSFSTVTRYRSSHARSFAVRTDWPSARATRCSPPPTARPRRRSTAR